MLLRLPLDIIIDVAFYLSVPEKYQLGLTCKKFTDVIFERCFYETVNLVNDKKETEFFLSNFRKYRSKAQKVKILKIQSSYLSNQLLSEIPLIFPNVVEYFDYSYEQKARPEGIFDEFIKWKDSLKRIKDNGSKTPSILFKILENHSFPHLAKLRISQLKYNDGNKIDFLEYIKNTPALRELTLEHHPVTLEDIETIHSRCPMLTTFEIAFCIIFIDKDTRLPKKITPAARLSQLVLTRGVICDSQCIYLDYLTRKYTKLNRLDFCPSFEEVMLELLFPDQYLDELISNPDFIAKRDELNTTREKYADIGSKILSNLPSTLKKIQIPTPDIHNAIAIFSKKCINITELDFITSSAACDTIFALPENIKVLKRLPFLKRLSLMLDSSLQKYEKTPASTTVTQLKVVIKGDSPDDDMDIGWMLSMFPSLYDLNIEYSATRLIGYEHDPPRTYPNLTKLYIGPSAVHPQLEKFICGAAPNLKDLHWWIYGEYVREDLELKHMNEPIVIQPCEAYFEDMITNYTIDLSNFYLDCLHLEMDLRRKKGDNKEDMILEVKGADKTIKEFIMYENLKCISADCYDLNGLKQAIDTRVSIVGGYTKTITINSCITIDLKKSELRSSF